MLLLVPLDWVEGRADLHPHYLFLKEITGMTRKSETKGRKFRRSNGDVALYFKLQ
jgi:hypothetical protein